MAHSADARLVELEEHLARVSLINEFTAKTNAAITEEDVFALAAEYTSRILHADRATVVLLTESGESVFTRTLVGASSPLLVGLEMPLSRTAVEVAVVQNKLISTPDVQGSPYLDHRALAEAGLRSHMTAPLMTAGKVIGTLNVSATVPGAYSTRDERLLSQTAAILASNLENRRLIGRLQGALSALEREHQQSDALLRNILPDPVAERMKRGELTIADRTESATVLFADIVGFTAMSAATSPEELVGMLNDVFTRFDLLADKHGAEKVKTIGDCYMVASGILNGQDDHAQTIAALALELRDALRDLRVPGSSPLQLRMGMHTGPVVAGVIGKRKFAYDLWGDTVNTASRMESHGEPGEVHCSQSVADRLQGIYEFEDRGVIMVKGKGPMHTYLLRGRTA
jgi:class 3 adenylate cyclase